MSHKAIRQLIESTARSLQDDIQYSYGTEADFALNKEKSLFLIHTDPLVAVPGYRSNNSTTNFMKQWGVAMAFWHHDEMSSSMEEYAEILDFADSMVDKFINKLNFFTPLSGTFILQGFNQLPFVKMTNIGTGYTLTFQMLVSDNFDYCDPCT